MTAAQELLEGLHPRAGSGQQLHEGRHERDDQERGGEAETISAWTPATPGRYYLVVDLWSVPEDPLSPWAYDLTVDID